MHNFHVMRNGGIYAGEFWETHAEPFEGGGERWDAYRIPYQDKGLISFFQAHGLEATLRTVGTLLSEDLGWAVVYYAFWAFPLVALGGLLRRDLFTLLVVTAVAYRVLLSMVAVARPWYTGHLYAFYALTLVLALHYMRSFLTSLRHRAE